MPALAPRKYMYYSSHTASEDEKSAFLKFVAKKCETADSVLDFSSLVEEYKEKHLESTATEYSLKAVIYNYRMTIHQKRLDLWTKIRQSFALSASLNPKFLKDMRRVGSLFVDDLNQIIKFDSNDKSLSLQNNAYMEAVKKEKEREQRSFIKFLTKVCNDAETPVIIKRAIQVFQQISGSKKSFHFFATQVQEYRKTIWSSENMDLNTKIRHMFALGVSVEKEVLEELQKNGDVKLNEKTLRIMGYQAHNGSFQIGMDTVEEDSEEEEEKGKEVREGKDMKDMPELEKNERSLLLHRNVFGGNEEFSRLIRFVGEECMNANIPLNIAQVVRDYKVSTGSQARDEYLSFKIRNYRDKIQNMEHLDLDSKIKQIFALRARMEFSFLVRLRKNATVEVDACNRIMRYKSASLQLGLRDRTEYYVMDPPSKRQKTTDTRYDFRALKSVENEKLVDFTQVLKLHNDQPCSSSKGNISNKELFETIGRLVDMKPQSQHDHPLSEQEHTDFIRFLTEKCENVKNPFNINCLVREFKQRTGSLKSENSFCQRVYKYKENIHRMDMDLNTKVKQMFALSSCVYTGILKELRKNAAVQVDDKFHIIGYRAHDGSLNLRKV